MISFSQLPLGRRIPDSLHAVSCSLPTLKDIIGYEEKDPKTLRHMSSGYPRFVVHPLLREIETLWRKRYQLDRKTLWLTSSGGMARALSDHLRPADCRLIEDGGLAAVYHDDNSELNRTARAFLQHVGGFLPSRQAEDYLVQCGFRERIEPEAVFDGPPDREVRAVLARLLGLGDAGAVCLANSGMNAVYAAFRAVAAVQSQRGRSVWLQVGWLYLDTIAILRDFTGKPENYRMVPDVCDLELLASVLADCGDRVAGIMIEAPTNPLVQTPDLEAVRILADKHDALLVIDPTIASPANVDVFRFADVLVNSLTKYAASDGDVIAGAVVVNPGARDAAELRRHVSDFVEPPYARDTARLALEMQDYGSVVNRINSNTQRLAAFLQGHPAVRKVFWALEAKSAENYRKIARHPDAVGCMITFELNGALQDFYNRIPLAKGPSFGIRTSLLCPFMYMAHYELASRPEGRDHLRRLGIDPDLIRVSVGTEPIDDLIAAFAHALG